MPATDTRDDELETSDVDPAGMDLDETSKPRKDELLDEGLEDTFPASDPMPAPHIT